MLIPLCCLSSESSTGSRDEADEFVEIGALNGIFVLGRSMGFIGESHSDSANAQTILSIISKVLIVLCFIRALPGPEEAETGSVPPPVGRHLLRAS